MSKLNLLKDDLVLENFIAHLAANGQVGLAIDRRPDKENRGSQDIDAIAGNFAIEHTSVDTIQDQRFNDAMFMKAVGDLETSFRKGFGYRLSIGLPYNAIRKKQNWLFIKSAVKEWIVIRSPQLSDGFTKVADVPGIPFEMYVNKSSNRLPGVFFARVTPDDKSLSSRIKLKFEEKIGKLKPYRQHGKSLVLLVESFDMALMNEFKMIRAIQDAFPAGVPVDALWYVDTSIQTDMRFYDITSDVVTKPN